MKTITLLLAAGTLAFAPAAFAKPPENGKGGASAKASGKANASVRVNKTTASTKVNTKAQAKAGSPANSQTKGGAGYRPGSPDRVRTTGGDGTQWMHRGRTYEQFDVPAYRLPPGQAKKLFNRGERLPASYYAQNPTYVLSNPAQYQLQPAPAGYRWVRVDNDVYLVRTQTGLIAEVVRRIFR